MIQMILTEEQQQILTNAQEPVEILDRRGRVLTRVRWGWSDAEIAEALERSRNSGPAVPVADFFERLKKSHPIPAGM